MRKVCLFIFNPVSGVNEIEKEELEEILEVKLPHFKTHFVETTGSNDSNKIQSEYERIKPDLVLIGGGDGTQGTETVHSLIADKQNNIYLYGATSSTDFPIVNGYQSTHGGGVPNSNFYFNASIILLS